MMKKKIIILLIIIIFVIGFTLIIANEFVPKKTFNKEDYLKLDHAGLPEFIIFPEAIDTMEVCDYHHYDYGLLDGIEVYLEITFTDGDYEKEIERLEKIQYNSEKLGFADNIRFDDSNLFNLPTYYTVYNSRGTYEYACVDKNNRKIIYIVLYNMSPKRVSLSEELLPKDYFDLMDVDSEEEHYSFSIYRWPSEGKA